MKFGEGGIPEPFCNLRDELAALRAENETMSQVLADLYNELGCEHDNEAGLAAIAALRAENERLRKALGSCGCKECAAALAQKEG